LIATDHAARRQLARSAAAEGWSVRVLEERARAANHEGLDTERTRTPAREVHPDQLDACATIAGALTTVLGADVRVVVARRGAYRAELLFESPEQALELAARLAR
jgi:ParB family chromosome partitioning protein